MKQGSGWEPRSAHLFPPFDPDLRDGEIAGDVL